MAEILAKCEGNNSPKYDGKVWKEALKFVVSVNGVAVDLREKEHPKVNCGDRVLLYRPGKGGKRGRHWTGIVVSQSDLEEASNQPKPLMSDIDNKDSDALHSDVHVEDASRTGSANKTESATGAISESHVEHTVLRLHSGSSNGQKRKAKTDIQSKSGPVKKVKTKKEVKGTSLLVYI